MAYNKLTKTMTGTTGTKYDVIATFQNGAIGYRELGSGQYRVRVEPFGPGTLSLGAGWANPGGSGASERYSKVVTGSFDFSQAILEAVKAIQGFQAKPASKPAPVKSAVAFG